MEFGLWVLGLAGKVDRAVRWVGREGFFSEGGEKGRGGGGSGGGIFSGGVGEKKSRKTKPEEPSQVKF